VQVGATLGRRFTLVRAEDFDLPGVERFLANDSRLNRDVTVDIITAPGPSEVKRAASKAALVRDPRLLRIVTSGREHLDDHDVTYVVSERPAGTRLSDVLVERVLDPTTAGAIAGDVARALQVAAASGLHHGHVRAEALTITPRARVVLAGLGVDAELASQTGLDTHHPPRERTDAVDVARLYVSAITGKDSAEVTVDDLPEELSARARGLCTAVIKGSGPHSLDDVTKALVPFSSQDLHGFAAGISGLPWRPDIIAQRAADLAARIAEINAAITIAPQTIITASLLVDWRTAEQTSTTGTIPSLSQELAAPESGEYQPYVDGDITDLYHFEAMAEAQNAEIEPSLWEEVLEGLHHRWPRSERITSSLTRAHERAQRTAPINAGPLWMAISVVAIVIAAMVGFSMISEPFNPDFVQPDPVPAYPPFTFTPDASASIDLDVD